MYRATTRTRHSLTRPATKGAELVLVAFILAVALYVVTVSVFTCGLLWRLWLVMAGSVVLGGVTLLLASASSGLWLRVFDGIGGIGSIEGLSVVAVVLMVSWFVSLQVFTREGADDLLMRLTDKAKSLRQ